MAPDLGAALAVAARAWVAETVGDQQHVIGLVADLLHLAAAHPDGPTPVAHAVLDLWCDMAGQACLVHGPGAVTVVAGEEDGGEVRDALWWAGQLVTAHTRADRDRVALLFSVWPAAGLGAAMMAVLNVAATVFLHAMTPHTQA